MKRFLLFLLAFLILFSVPNVTYAAGGGMTEQELIEDVVDNVKEVQKAANSVQAIADSAKASTTFKDVFDGFCKGVSISSSVLSTINGSVTFLRLIGVMEDPVTSQLNSISKSIISMNERLGEMDTKLNKITNQMSKMTALIEFNNRTQNAMTLTTQWENFITNYCENGMDRLMSEYEGMLMNGIISWCKNASADTRTEGDVDNTSIAILYKKTSKGYELTFSSENGVPKNFTKDDRYVIIDTKLLPEKVEWNVNTYQSDLKAAMLNAVSALLRVDKSGITVYNYDELYKNLNTKNQSMYLNNLAEDAVSTLLYRIACTQVNKDAAYSKEVIRNYLNYYSTLFSGNRGIDAILKAYYFTHNFQSEASSDITELCNSLMVKNAVYGMFLLNIIGASNTVTDSEKYQLMEFFDDSMTRLKQAKKNALVPDNNFCYYTRSILYIDTVEFHSSAYAKINHSYSGYYNVYTLLEHHIDSITHASKTGGGDSSILDDVSIQVLKMTASSMGSAMNFDYIKTNMHGTYVHNYNYIITSIDPESQFTFDGSMNIEVRNFCGKYFPTGTYSSTLPSKAELEYFDGRRKVTGGVYNTATGEYTSNQILLAHAMYSEDHTYWNDCESAIMAAAVNNGEGFYITVSTVNVDVLGEGEYMESVTSRYNTIFSYPYGSSNLLTSTDEYNPLASYAEVADSEIILEDVVIPELKGEAEQDTNNNALLFAIGGISAVAIASTLYLRKKKEH